MYSNLDRMSTVDLLSGINAEDHKVPEVKPKSTVSMKVAYWSASMGVFTYSLK